ncbi:hypothetical protein MCOR02_000860 [Pyricularia oryzae]|nr:hypothetical protein MCOR02_000860 [Pyricularia oryzae]
MGLGSYFKADKPAASSPTSSPSTPAAVSSSGKLSAPQPSHLRPSGRSPSSNGEKSGADGGNDYELQPPSTRFNSRRPVFRLGHIGPTTAPSSSRTSSTRSWSTTCTSNSAPSSGSLTAAVRLRACSFANPRGITWLARHN